MTPSITQRLAVWLGEITHNPAAGTLMSVVIFLVGMVAVCLLGAWLLARYEDNDQEDRSGPGRPHHPTRSSKPPRWP